MGSVEAHSTGAGDEELDMKRPVKHDMLHSAEAHSTVEGNEELKAKHPVQHEVLRSVVEHSTVAGSEELAVKHPVMHEVTHSVDARSTVAAHSIGAERVASGAVRDPLEVLFVELHEATFDVSSLRDMVWQRLADDASPAADAGLWSHLEAVDKPLTQKQFNVLVSIVFGNLQGIDAVLANDVACIVMTHLGEHGLLPPQARSLFFGKKPRPRKKKKHQATDLT